MLAVERLEHIVALVKDRGFVSVKELSHLFDVSEVTIRRDLQRLSEDRRLRRTHGGAAALQTATLAAVGIEQPELIEPADEGFVTDRLDVLIAPSFDPYADQVLFDRTKRKNIPIIAESVGMPGAVTLVTVDDFQAGLELGRWVGNHIRYNCEEQARVLDLTYHLDNTHKRSQGFLTGLKEILPAAQTILSIDAELASATAYRLTVDALQIYPEINVIFAVNDATAWGAIEACQAIGVNPDSVLVVPFGLEDNTLRDTLLARQYCKVGLAMFPEIVGPVCVEAAIKAYNVEPLPQRLLVPYAILTSETLLDFFKQTEMGWQLNWESVEKRLALPLNIHNRAPLRSEQLPGRIGFIIPHTDHEWYRKLITFMKLHLNGTQTLLETIHAEQHFRDEVSLRKRKIAQMGLDLIEAGDVLLIDHGQINTYLAEALAMASEKHVTVITHSIPIFEILRDRPHITLILTGGLLPQTSDILVGPTVESALKELRADKLLLAITGISLDFGLSHTNLAEVALKQAMIRAAREVILLADHTKFGLESVVQVAPITIVNKLITDNPLPASIRLELIKLRVGVVLADT